MSIHNKQAEDAKTSAHLRPEITAGGVSSFICLLLVAALVIWCFVSIDLDFSRTLTGLSKGMVSVRRMIPTSPADFGYDRQLVTSSTIRTSFAETIQMAVVGTVTGALLALPMSFLAARTGSTPRWFSGAVKTFLNIGRAIPTIVYALVAIYAVGLGKATGAIAIGFVSFIGLAKLYAEALESVSPGPIEAVRAAGGNSFQVFVYGMLPQVFPHYLATTLFTFEYNLKESFIVGIVGAGGLGQELFESIQLFQWKDAGVVIGLLIVLINLVDYFSYRVRLKFT